MTYSLTIDHFTPSDARLGRHVLHDSRSLNYPAPEGGPRAWRSVRHQRFIPILNQGNLGSCTGNAAVGCLGTAQFWDDATKQVLSPTDAARDENEAVKLYSAATGLDPFEGAYPPNDTGSNGLSVAKACKNAGLISGYTHAFSLDALLTALSKQPVIVGTRWTHDMFTPDADGRLHPSGEVAGGHEYALDELDVDRQHIGMTNSWGSSWGQDGRAWFSFDDFDSLLHRHGDCTVFTPVAEPSPTPTPSDEVTTLIKDAAADARKVSEALDKALGKLS